MSISKKAMDEIRERDKGFCLMALPNCLGEGDVPHHRANRGSGGSKTLDHPANLVLVCSLCNGAAEDAAAMLRLDLIDRGLRVEKAATNAATLARCIETPVTDLEGERWYLISTTERRHVSEGRPSSENPKHET